MKHIRTRLLLVLTALVVSGSVAILASMGLLSGALDRQEAQAATFSELDASQQRLQSLLQRMLDAVGRNVRLADTGAVADAERVDAAYRSELATLQGHARALADPPTEALVAELVRLHAADVRPAEERIASLLERGLRADALGTYWEEYMPARNTLAEGYDRLRAHLREVQHERSRELRRRVTLAQVLVGVTLLLWALLSGAVALGLTRWLVGPVLAMAEAAQRAARGDFAVRLPFDGRQDELGTLSRSLNGLYSLLETFAGSLAQSVAGLRQAVVGLVQVSDLQRRDSERQAAAVFQVSQLAQELQQLSERAGEQVKASLARASELDGMADRLHASSGTSLQVLGALEARGAALARQAEGLEEVARSIGAVTATVRDIADQSNMLALNAGIEAMRSGEHGRGFGVVAREMRVLADQSREATGQVAQLLSRAREDIQRTVALAEAGREQAASGRQQAEGAAAELAGIGAVLETVTSSVGELTTIAREQGSGIQQVFQAVREQEAVMHSVEAQLRITEGAIRDVDGCASEVDAVLQQLRQGRFAA